MDAAEVKGRLRAANASGMRGLVSYGDKLRMIDVLTWPGPDRVLVWQYLPVVGVRLLLVHNIEWVGVVRVEDWDRAPKGPKPEPPDEF